MLAYTESQVLKFQLFISIDSIRNYEDTNFLSE
jgi:hypothetical protein